MTVEYVPETDTLTITFVPTPYEQETVLDTPDDDVLLLYDVSGRLAEIVIEHASARTDLAELRRKVSFEEIRPAPASPAT
jgi:uncharacterized protein YuzE